MRGHLNASSDGIRGISGSPDPVFRSSCATNTEHSDSGVRDSPSSISTELENPSRRRSDALLTPNEREERVHRNRVAFFQTLPTRSVQDMTSASNNS